MSELQETTVMKVACALYELENDQPYALSWVDASKSESMLEYYVEQAECAILASAFIESQEALGEALGLLEYIVKDAPAEHEPYPAGGQSSADDEYERGAANTHFWLARAARAFLSKHKDKDNG